MNDSVDRQWMALALELAAGGAGNVEPNPLVGCVIVRNDEEIGRGFHAEFGGPHAEIAALDDCPTDPAGSTVYVNLEPCCHHGKTPPCVDRLIQAGIARVVVAHRDPFPAVNGGGIEQLEQAGIQVDTGILEPAARHLNAPWLKRVVTGRPWVIGKWAMSLDGKIATCSGDSKWISGEASRREAHRMRGQVEAIAVGSRTALLDNPLLTARPAGSRIATRVVIDSGLILPADSQLATTTDLAPTVVITGTGADPDKVTRLEDQGCQVVTVDGADRARRLDQGLLELGRRQVTRVLVEGGGGLLGGLFDLGQIDEVCVFVGNRIVGGGEAPGPVAGSGFQRIAESLQLTDLRHQSLEDDVLIRGRVAR